MLAAIVNAASYGPDIRLDAEGVHGGLIKQFIPNSAHRAILIVDIFLLYFIYTFIIALTEMITAAATTSWYFTKKQEAANMPGLTVMGPVFQYHCGTVSKLAVYKFFFKIMRNCAAALKSVLRKGKQDNTLIRFMMATFLPVIALYERYLKYISKDLLAITAMWGDQYFEASRKSFFMIKFRHPGDGYGALSWISYLQFSIKVSISLLIASCVYIYCYFLTISPFQNDISTVDTPILPFLFVFITSLFVTSIWIAPYDMMLRTILQCYSMDNEMFRADGRFAEEILENMVTKLGEVSRSLKQDSSFFCFQCKKKQVAPKGDGEGHAEWTEDLEELREAEEYANEDMDDRFSDEELQDKKPHNSEDQGVKTGGGFAEDQIEKVRANPDELDFDDDDKMTAKGSMKSSISKLSRKKAQAKDRGNGVLEGPLGGNAKGESDPLKRPVGKVLIPLNNKPKIQPAVNEKNE